MDYVVQPNLQLGRHSLLRIEDGHGMLVYVWSGALWITQEGDPSDRFVAAGGRFRIGARGLTLISALGRSRITITAPGAAAPGWLAALRARLAAAL